MKERAKTKAMVRRCPRGMARNTRLRARAGPPEVDPERSYQVLVPRRDFAPRDRLVQSSQARVAKQLADLAVLNDKLSGRSDWLETRRKAEFLKAKARNWRSVFDTITKVEAASTLEAIAAAQDQVEEALSEGNRESKALSDLQMQLEELQQQLKGYQSKLTLAEARVQKNMDLLSVLKKEADGLPSPFKEDCYDLCQGDETARLEGGEDRAIGSSILPGQMPSAESLELLRNRWHAVEFSRNLTDDMLVPIELYGTTWVLWRDNEGSPGCIRDECAHRACPLSLGRVVDGKVQCPYHGWEYMSDGKCVATPSCSQLIPASVKSLPCVEGDGVILVWPGKGVPSIDIPSNAPPEGYQSHVEMVFDIPMQHTLLLEGFIDPAPVTRALDFVLRWSTWREVEEFKIRQEEVEPTFSYDMDINYDKSHVVTTTVELPVEALGSESYIVGKHVHQMYACIPKSKDSTRLLYRMSLDFQPIGKALPFMDRLFKEQLRDHLNKEVEMLAMQQEKILRQSR